MFLAASALLSVGVVAAAFLRASAASARRAVPPRPPFPHIPRAASGRRTPGRAPPLLVGGNAHVSGGCVSMHSVRGWCSANTSVAASPPAPTLLSVSDALSWLCLRRVGGRSVGWCYLRCFFCVSTVARGELLLLGAAGSRGLHRGCRSGWVSSQVPGGVGGLGFPPRRVAPCPRPLPQCRLCWRSLLIARPCTRFAGRSVCHICCICWFSSPGVLGEALPGRASECGSWFLDGASFLYPDCSSACGTLAASAPPPCSFCTNPQHLLHRSPYAAAHGQLRDVVGISVFRWLGHACSLCMQCFVRPSATQITVAMLA